MITKSFQGPRTPMPRWFNIAGPCKADIHYMLPIANRLPDLTRLINQQSYFVCHAPRQTGKTTAMLTLAKTLTASGQFTAVVVSVEVGAAFRHDVSLAEQAILGAWRSVIPGRLPADLCPPDWIEGSAGQRIQANLRHWATHSDRPLVIFKDNLGW